MSRTPWFPEIFQALGAVIRLARFDRRAAVFFRDDLDQCARSFRVCVLIFPFYVMMLLGDLSGDDSMAGDPVIILLANSIGFVVQCLVFPVAAMSLLRWYGREARWARLVTAYNWSGLGQTIAVGAGLFLHRITGGSAFSIDVLAVVYLFCLIVEGFIFETVLDVGLLTAGTLVVVDILLGHLVAMVANAIA